MLTVYGCASTRSLRVVWLLEELEEPYEYRFINLRAGDHRKAPFIELNPGGKVPVVVDGDVVLSESAAICTWLGDAHPGSGLVPHSGSPDRGRYEQWCSFVIAELEQPLWTIAKHSFALPEKHRVPAIETTARWEFARAAKVLQRHVETREHLVADRFTAADVLAGHTLSWARNRLETLGSEILDAYLDRLLVRPALARAREREAAAVS